MSEKFFADGADRNAALQLLLHTKCTTLADTALAFLSRQKLEGAEALSVEVSQ